MIVSGSAIISCICPITLLDSSATPLLDFGLSFFIMSVISLTFINLNFKEQFGLSFSYVWKASLGLFDLLFSTPPHIQHSALIVC